MPTGDPPNLYTDQFQGERSSIQLSDNYANFTAPSEDYLYITLPYYKWEYRLGKDSNCVYSVKEAPNRFHRWMQEKLLGIYWTSLDKKKGKM